MDFVKKWAGVIYGTNTGNVSLEIDDSDDGYVGLLRILDDKHGIALYLVHVAIEADVVRIQGVPKDERPDLTKLGAVGRLTPSGEVSGDWETELGTGGTFRLFPHGSASSTGEQPESGPQQIFSKKVSLGPVTVSKHDLESLGSAMEREFPDAEVVVTISQETQQSTLFRRFVQVEYSSSPTTFAKLFVQQKEEVGFNRLLTIEFGQLENFVLAQSVEESRAIGLAENFGKKAGKYERLSVLDIRKWGVGFNQIILLVMLVFLPSIEKVSQRFFYVFSVALLILAFNFLHSKFIPNAFIELIERDPSKVFGIFMKLASWVLAVFTAILVAFLSTKIDVIWLWIGALFEPNSSEV